MTLEPISGIVHQPTIWEGLIDGRLNPDMTEYYSVWCENNLVRVLRSSPSPETVAEFPLAEINRLGAGISPLMVNGVIATRISDTIYLSGSNGNLAPLPGSKSFSLPACNERSGGAPPAPPDTPADGAQPAAPTEIDLSQCENQTFVDQNPVLCGDSANPDSGISIMWRLISGACYFYGIVPAAFSMVFVFRGSRKRDERLRDKAERDTERQ